MAFHEVRVFLMSVVVAVAVHRLGCGAVLFRLVQVTQRVGARLASHLVREGYPRKQRAGAYAPVAVSERYGLKFRVPLVHVHARQQVAAVGEGRKFSGPSVQGYI